MAFRCSVNAKAAAARGPCGLCGVWPRSAPALPLRAVSNDARSCEAREEFQGNGAAAGADALTAGKSAEPAPGGEGGERGEESASECASERLGGGRERGGSSGAKPPIAQVISFLATSQRVSCTEKTSGSHRTKIIPG